MNTLVFKADASMDEAISSPGLYCQFKAFGENLTKRMEFALDYMERDSARGAIHPGPKILARYLQTGLGFSARPNGLKNPCNRYYFFHPGPKEEGEHAHRLCFRTSVNFSWKLSI